MSDTTFHPEQLEPHPLSMAFPSMSAEDFASLVEDIRENGQRLPIVVLDGQALDGRHRLRACLQIGLPPVIEQFKGDDPVAFVLSQNLHRRHLSASQRASAVVACNEWAPLGANQHAGRVGNIAHPQSEESVKAVTNAEMAKLAQVGARTIKDAKAAHKAGLTEAVKDGAMSVSEAAKIARGTPGRPKVATAPATPPAVSPAPNSQAAREEAFKQAAQEANGDFDALTAFEEAQREILQLQAQIKAASADDAKASAMHWQRMSMVADRQRDDAMGRAHKMEQGLKQHAKWLLRIGHHFGEDVPSRVVGVVDAGVRRLGHLVSEGGAGKVLPAVERALREVARRAAGALPTEAMPPAATVPAPIPPISAKVAALVAKSSAPHLLAEDAGVVEEEGITS